MTYSQNGIGHTYVLKTIISPANWLLLYNNGSACVLHETHRLCEVKLRADQFCSLAKYDNIPIYG